MGGGQDKTRLGYPSSRLPPFQASQPRSSGQSLHCQSPGQCSSVLPLPFGGSTAVSALRGLDSHSTLSDPDPGTEICLLQGLGELGTQGEAHCPTWWVHPFFPLRATVAGAKWPTPLLPQPPSSLPSASKCQSACQLQSPPLILAPRWAGHWLILLSLLACQGIKGERGYAGPAGEKGESVSAALQGCEEGLQMELSQPIPPQPLEIVPVAWEAGDMTPAFKPPEPLQLPLKQWAGCCGGRI